MFKKANYDIDGVFNITLAAKKFTILLQSANPRRHFGFSFVTSFFRVTKSSRRRTVLRANVTRYHVIHVPVPASSVRLGVLFNR